MFIFYSNYPTDGLPLSICLDNTSSNTCTVGKKKNKNLHFLFRFFLCAIGLTKSLYKTNVGSSFKWNSIPTIHFINQLIKLFCHHWSTWFQFISDLRTPSSRKKKVVVSACNQKETIFICLYIVQVHLKWS